MLIFTRALLFTLTIVLTVGASITTLRADDAATTQYILNLNQYRSQRHQPEAPRPDKKDIADALDGDLVIKKKDLDGTLDGTGLRSLWAAKILKADAADWWMTAIDREDYELISAKNIRDSFIVQSFEGHFYNFNVLTAPLISYRYQVLDAQVNTKLFAASSGKMWEHHWNLVADVPGEIKKALAMNKLVTLEKDDLEDAVIPGRNDGSWVVIPLPDGRIWVDTYSVNNPGGSIPKWIVRKIGGMATKGTFRQYEEWVREKVRPHLQKKHGELLGPDGAYRSPTAMRTFLEALPGSYAASISALTP